MVSGCNQSDAMLRIEIRFYGCRLVARVRECNKIGCGCGGGGGGENQSIHRPKTKNGKGWKNNSKTWVYPINNQAGERNVKLYNIWLISAKLQKLEYQNILHFTFLISLQKRKNISYNTKSYADVSIFCTIFHFLI